MVRFLIFHFPNAFLVTSLGAVTRQDLDKAHDVEVIDRMFALCIVPLEEIASLHGLKSSLGLNGIVEKHC